MRYAMGLAIMTIANGAAAQTVDRPFTGPSIGIEAGLLEHHFALEFEEYENDTLVSRYDRYYRANGLGAGVFAGYDIAASRNWRLGAEIAGTAGGRDNRATFEGLVYDQKPKFGIRGTVRAGYVMTPRLMAYGSVGYGGNKYRIRDQIGIGDDFGWGNSFVVGGGAEYRIDRRYGVRMDVKHVDNQTWQAFVGVPIRF
jgi:outer membrane immunogenic protein